jgi:hypothetical protein
MLLRVRAFAEQPPICAVQALLHVTESVLSVAAIGSASNLPAIISHKTRSMFEKMSEQTVFALV